MARRDTRERILDAAAEVMRRYGAAGATTKQIAQEAGCSEPLLYRHFKDKNDLILHVLTERVKPATRDVVPGEGSVADNLLALAQAAVALYRRTFPMMGTLLARPDLLAATRDSLDQHQGGPEHVVTSVADYLKGEQALGRVAQEVDAYAAAALLLGGCFQQVFLAYYRHGLDTDPDSPDLPDPSKALTSALLRALGI